MTKNTFFPEGLLGQKKDRIYQNIRAAEDGGLDRKSVLVAMDEYAEYYHSHMVLEAFRQTPTYYFDSNGKKRLFNSRYSRIKNLIKNRVQYNWIKFKYWARHKRLIK